MHAKVGLHTEEQSLRDKQKVRITNLRRKAEKARHAASVASSDSAPALLRMADDYDRQAAEAEAAVELTDKD